MSSWSHTAMARAPPEPPSPMMVETMGTSSLRHLEDAAADGFGLAALLGTDSGIRPHRVDEGEDGQAELLGGLHEALRLAVALGPRHAEVAHRASLVS